jgi:hypothetical protein
MAGHLLKTYRLTRPLRMQGLEGGGGIPVLRQSDRASEENWGVLPAQDLPNSGRLKERRTSISGRRLFTTLTSSAVKAVVDLAFT